MIDEKKKELFKEAIDGCSTIHIFMHDEPPPDPDAIGSAMGMRKLLKDVFQKAVVIHGIPPDHPMNIQMVSELDVTLLDPRDPKTMAALQETGHGYIVVDSTINSGSFRFKELLKDKKPLWEIDHHPPKDASISPNSDVQSVGSCSTIVVDYLTAFDAHFDADSKIDRYVATALKLGLMIDTDNLSCEDIDVARDVGAFTYLHTRCDPEMYQKIYKYNIPRYFNEALQTTFKEHSQKIQEPFAILTPGFLKEERLGVLSFIADHWIRVDQLNIVVVFAISDNRIIASIRTKGGSRRAPDLVMPLFPTGGGGGKKYAARASATINGMYDTALLDDAGKEALLTLNMKTLVARMNIFTNAE